MRVLDYGHELKKEKVKTVRKKMKREKKEKLWESRLRK